MKLCVYGASSSTIDKSFIDAGEALGRAIAQRGHTVVYGGGAEGMMGAAARGAKEKNGEIIGIAPSFFKVDGSLFEGCTEFIYTDNMRQRKELLETRSDAYIVTPGGAGTYDEFFEIFTLRQLNRHTKAIAILNINGYFDPLIALLENAIEKNFMTEANRELYFVSDNIDETLEYIENYKPVEFSLDQFKDIK